MRTCHSSSRLVSGTLGTQSGQGTSQQSVSSTSQQSLSSVLVSATSAAEYMYVPVMNPPAKNRMIPFHIILTFWVFVIVLSSW